jgi:uncharacterized protein (DUF1800 family)
MLKPLRESDWNDRTAAHLLNRAGFGGSPADIERLARLTPAEAVDRLVNFERLHEKFDPPSWVVPGEELRPDRPDRLLSAEERQRMQRERRLEERDKMTELRAWWLYRMRYSPRPLQEKLTLFWHGHFATSVQKVRLAYAMYLQNETLRRLAHGNWRDLVVAVAQDPAMLWYLDNALSRPDAPNENFARELMELFTLGEGRYSETDIKEAARAFSGWTVHTERIAFVNRRRLRDTGTKRFLGRTGNFDGNDIIQIILQQPAAAAFITRKLWSFFAFDDPPDDLVAPLADSFRRRSYELKPLLREMFLSEAFYSERARMTQIKSPAQWLVGTVKALDAPMPSAEACQYALRALGQELFAPPNVKGWDGGFSWITTAALLHRYNFSGALLKGTEGWRPDPADDGLAAMVRRRQLYGQLPAAGSSFDRRFLVDSIADADTLLPAGQRTDLETALATLQRRLFPVALRVKDAAAFRDYAEHLPPPAEWTHRHVLDVAHLMMSSPVYQLC